MGGRKLKRLFGAAAIFLMAGTPAPARAAQASVLFVTTTDACNCTLNRCTVGRQEVDKFLHAFPTEFRLKIVDVSKEPAATKTYKTAVLPAAFLRGPDGAQIARFDGFFTEADLSQAWGRHLSAKGGRP